MRFAETLKDLRRVQKLTLDELSAKSGVHKMTISKLENGLHEPRLLTIKKLSTALECEFEYLYQFTNKQ